MESTHTISSYMIQRLYECGVNHIFRVPRDYVPGFYNQLLHSNKLKIINTCDELAAALAADAYVRVKGFGAFCITYCAGA